LKNNLKVNEKLNLILENKKTYILHRFMYKVYIKGLEDIGFL